MTENIFFYILNKIPKIKSEIGIDLHRYSTKEGPYSEVRLSNKEKYSPSVFLEGWIMIGDKLLNIGEKESNSFFSSKDCIKVPTKKTEKIEFRKTSAIIEKEKNDNDIIAGISLKTKTEQILETGFFDKFYYELTKEDKEDGWIWKKCPPKEEVARKLAINKTWFKRTFILLIILGLLIILILVFIKLDFISADLINNF